jgi:hypothetical protein
VGREERGREDEPLRPAKDRRADERRDAEIPRQPGHREGEPALSDGHQCQPSRSKPPAMVAPSVSSGIGGIWRGDFGG